MLLNPFQSFLNHVIPRERQRRLRRGNRRNARLRDTRGRSKSCPAVTETLEDRLLLAATPLASPGFALPGQQLKEPLSPGAPASPQTTGVSAPSPSKGLAPPVSTINPTEMQTAYGVNRISFGGVQGTGAGQTIAIVDPLNDPYIVGDANSFSYTYKLQQFNVPGGPTLQVLNQTGGTSLSLVPNDTPGTWDVQESLDVEWAHAIAPQANIIVFEANTATLPDLLIADKTAAATPGVSVVSDGWYFSEFATETADDAAFLTPTGHQGVTFLAATGNSGAPGGYPAYSPNVVAVGGTTLYLNSQGTYEGESAWTYSGGGVSLYESQPSYQTGKVNGASTTNRTAPDISLDGDPNSGASVLDTLEGGYMQLGGTALSTSLMAGLVAIADQGRVLNGDGTLDGPSQTLPLLYNLSSANDHDITTGNNGSSATVGYDTASGLGSPIANNLVSALAGFQSSAPPSVTAPMSATVLEDGSYTFSGIDRSQRSGGDRHIGIPVACGNPRQVDAGLDHAA